MESAPLRVRPGLPSSALVPQGGPRTRAVRTAEVWFAVVLCVLIGMRYPRYDDIQFAAVLSLALIPIWAGSLRRFRGATTILLVGVLAILGGMTLTAFAEMDHTVSSYLTTMNSARLAGVLVYVGVLLWARTKLGTAAVAVLVGLGMIVSIPIIGTLGTNPWKFGLSVPIAVFALGLAWMLARRWVDIVLLLVLGGISALNDSRSAAAMFVLAAAVVGMQRVRLIEGKRHVWWALARLGIIAYLVFVLAQAAILDGYLGAGTEARTEAQIETSGSVILGGRPELGATISLLLHQPVGYGSGTTPSMTDLLVAKSGMASLGYDPNNGYVEHYMFSPGFEVHSIVGDVWVVFGLAGLAWILCVAGFSLFGLGTRLAQREISGLEAFLGIRTMWDLFFSPFPSSLATLTLLIAVILVRRSDGSIASRPTADERTL